MKYPEFYLTDDKYQFIWEYPQKRKLKKYTHSLLGKDGKQPFTIHMSREAIKKLIGEMVKVL